jgi:4-hydroxybenzoate polyprenyltransferase
MKVLPGKLAAYARLTRMDKPIGTLLLLWPTLTALWIAADGKPSGYLIFVFIAGTFLMRSAGCAVNDYADREFDGHVARTKNRPMVTGEVSAKEAWIVAAVLAFAAFLLIVPINVSVVLWSLPALGVAIVYPFTKRFLASPQSVLGIAFSFGIPMAFAAARGHVPFDAWILLGINWFWVMAYDTEYAMVDRADDEKLSIGTSAKWFGKHDVLAVMACYAIYVIAMVIFGVEKRYGIAYFLGLLAASGIAIYHFTLIRRRDPARCFKAFLHNHWFGFSVFVGVAAQFFIAHSKNLP